MRNFIFAKNGFRQAATEVGYVDVVAMSDGVVSSTGNFVYDTPFYIRLVTENGNVDLPCYNYHFSANLAKYQAGSKYTASVTIPEPTVDGNYSLILAKKGVKFNERNRWTASVPVKVGDSAEAIAAKIAKFFEANASNLNIAVSVEGAAISLEGNKVGEDFKLIGADELLGVAVEETAATAAIGDYAYIKDLADKAAADAGYLYTYQDVDVNPGYPFEIKDAAQVSGQFDILTIRFAVPREVKTRDEVVHQIVQIVAPTGTLNQLNELFVEGGIAG